MLLRRDGDPNVSTLVIGYGLRLLVGEALAEWVRAVECFLSVGVSVLCLDGDGLLGVSKIFCRFSCGYGF